MRFPLYFRDVANIVPVTPQTELPSNIRIAKGDTKQEKLSNAVDLLREDSTANAVVIIEPPLAVGSVLSGLFSVAAGKRVRMEYDMQKRGGLSALPGDFATYLKGRAQGLTLPKTQTISSGAVSSATDFWQDHLQPCLAIPGAQVASSILTYVPHYTNTIAPDHYINLHVDHGDMHYRDVECVAGSGTVLCADSDFSIRRIGTGHAAFDIRITRTGITCWELMTGSSVVMRGPNLSARGEIPCAHAHGIGGATEPEQRFTFRNDLVAA